MIKDVERNPEDVAEFLSEATAYLEEVEPMLASLKTSGADASADAVVASIFRAFHSIKGVSGFLSFLTVQEVTHKAEEALDRVRTGKMALEGDLCAALLETCDFLRRLFKIIQSEDTDAVMGEEKNALADRLRAFTSASEAPTPASPAAPVAAPGQSLLLDGLLDDALSARFRAAAAEGVEALETVLVGFLDAPGSPAILAEAADRAERLRGNFQFFGHADAAALSGRLQQALRRPGIAFNPEELNLYFQACNALKALCAGDTSAEAGTQAAMTGMELDGLSAPKPTAAATVAAAAGTGNAAPAASAKPASAAAPVAADKNAAPAEGSGDKAVRKAEIRVSLDKLDKLVDLIEGLGVVSGSLSSLAARKDADEEEGMEQILGKLGQITEELQEVAMSVRLVPLSTVFRKMIRLVGDVSAKLGKKAHLEILGEETEIDKDVVDALQDPLVHILRNSVDHGLEMPEDRLAAGKPESGTVRLQAWHSGGEACISISDDGKGISREKVLAKAAAQGLVDPARKDLGDSEIFAFLFHPGFSLAKEVTEFSGRGVGMDVVKQNVERLKGRIEVESKAGQGSSFLIRLPMANALTESMLVRVGLVRYVIRIASIRETLRPASASVTTFPDGSEWIRLRDGFFPVVRIHRLHHLDGARSKLEDGMLVLVENRGRQFGLFVDEVLSRVQGVIKTAPPMLKRASTLAGYSIIGTRSDDVAWALDINRLDALAGAGAD